MSDAADALEIIVTMAVLTFAMLTVTFALVSAFVGIAGAIAAVLVMGAVAAAIFGFVYVLANGKSTADEDSGTSPADTDDALQRLRERYANGELSEETFERKLDALLATETEEKARRRVDGDERAVHENREFERSIE